MVDNKVQEAIVMIRSGDKQNGQRLLVEVLKQDPGNETAWLWMSSLVTGDKRRMCLERVLSINPNNALAKTELEKLSSSNVPPGNNAMHAEPVTQPDSTPVPSTMATDNLNRPMAAREVSADQVWLTPGKQMSAVVHLSADSLLAFDVLPNLAGQVVNEIRGGTTQKQLYNERKKYHLQNLCYLPLQRVKTVTLFGDLLKVLAVGDSGSEKRFNITCNKENSEAILAAFQERLGSSFTRITRPISRSQVLMSGLALFLITLCGTGFFYWFVQGLANEQVTGSARARGLANLLLLIGPNGFLCIGGVLMLIIMIAFISSLSKPPEETVLMHKPA